MIHVSYRIYNLRYTPIFYTEYYLISGMNNRQKANIW